MDSKLAEILFSDYRRKVLGLLLLHPDNAYHVREIARLTNTVAGTLHKELSRLAEAGVLLKQASGNQVLYQANPQCPIYPELLSIVKKTCGVEPVREMNELRNDKSKLVIGGSTVVSRKALQKLAKRFHIRRLVLFGSAARGELKPDSDIDLLVEFEKDRSPSLGGMVEIQDAFASLFGGRKVDVATPSILNNPYRKRAIEKDMEELYAA